MHRSTGLVLLAALATGAVGCQPYMTDERVDRGLVLVLTGVEGRSFLSENICHGLNKGGVDCGIELVDWTVPLPVTSLVTLRSRARNREQAERIAYRIFRYMLLNPGRPVTLVGQSGGAAMAVWVAESMPEGVEVDGIVLLASALSPNYRLDEALRHSRRGIVSFHSKRDWILLGAGTKVWGTMDGEHTSSAGRVGFNVPQGAPEVYGKLFQAPWHSKMGRAGHLGGHLTSGGRRYVARFVAPLVLAEQWTTAVVEAAVGGPTMRTSEAKDPP